MLTGRALFSERQGLKGKPRIKFELVRNLCSKEIKVFLDEGYFNEAFGYARASFDGPRQIHGSLGRDPKIIIAHRLQQDVHWPMDVHAATCGEPELFDVIEFLYEHVSYPRNFGPHDIRFDARVGRKEYREKINMIVQPFGYELSADGEILVNLPDDLKAELVSPKTAIDPENIEKRRDNALLMFRRRNATPDDKRQAVAELAHIFEFIRDDLKHALTKRDEGALFDIANNFGIRHHNDKQQTEYDPTWLTWMFVHFLSTLNFAIERIATKKKVKP